ncbi:hypothetical protein SY84_06415 [Deinococcus soli (ex Cha et al. 2016)]|uniref:Helix-turn-helix domain-containing protein n=2 Tax=Deinococcus soli (ex Cha et al. 2016) TaxID=1309411 RepID=A0A0F7JPQ6_9DEIO|nr:hypothetical protein SY84_06415 [Deinococcus soli (ex Cha et al. 2016)]
MGSPAGRARLDEASGGEQPMSKTEYFTVLEVAERYKLSPRVIYAAIHSGDLQALRLGRKLFRVSEDALRAWEQQGGQR